MTLEEKQNYAKEYIKSLKTIEEEMEVYKEQKRDLRNDYRENNWLTTHEIQAVVRAYLFDNIELFSSFTRETSEDK